jgi:hypothetical protein
MTILEFTPEKQVIEVKLEGDYSPEELMSVILYWQGVLEMNTDKVKEVVMYPKIVLTSHIDDEEDYEEE